MAKDARGFLDRVRYYVAEIVSDGISFACVLSGHAGGCRVMWAFNRVNGWAYGVMEAQRGPAYKEGEDNPHLICGSCGHRVYGEIPNPYYASEADLAAWARWAGSGVSPADYAEFWAERNDN